MKFIFLLILISIVGCNMPEIETEFEKSEPKNFKQNYAVHLPTIEGAVEYDNLKEYDIIIETKYENIDYYENIIPAGKGDSIIDVIVFADTNSYTGVIDKISERLPIGVEQIDFAVWSNGKPSIVKLDFEKIDMPGVVFYSYNKSFYILFNEKKRLMVNNYIQEDSILSLKQLYLDFYSDTIDTPEPGVNHYYKKKDIEILLENAISDFNWTNDKYYQAKIKRLTELLQIEENIFPIQDYNKCYNLISGGLYQSKTDISFTLELITKIRKFEKLRLTNCYPNLSAANIEKLEKLISPKTFYNLPHGYYTNPKNYIPQPPPPPKVHLNHK